MLSYYMLKYLIECKKAAKISSEYFLILKKKSRYTQILNLLTDLLLKLSWDYIYVRGGRMHVCTRVSASRL